MQDKSNMGNGCGNPKLNGRGVVREKQVNYTELEAETMTWTDDSKRMKALDEEGYERGRSQGVSIDQYDVDEYKEDIRRMSFKPDKKKKGLFGGLMSFGKSFGKKALSFGSIGRKKSTGEE
jgi:hypothetical protein